MATDNTGIRLIDVGDAEAITVHLARDRQAFARYEPTQPDTYYTLDGQRARIVRMREEHSRGNCWPGVVMADDVVIGQVTVGTIVRGPFRKGSVGYWIGTPHQNQGHARRAVSQVLQVMADDLSLHRAEASTQIANLPSQRVLSQNGFLSYGIAHSHIFINGAWRDGILWERTVGP